jgi:hypothetical protein
MQTVALGVIGMFVLVCCYGAALMVIDSERRKANKKLDTDQ